MPVPGLGDGLNQGRALTTMASLEDMSTTKTEATSPYWQNQTVLISSPEPLLGAILTSHGSLGVGVGGSALALRPVLTLATT